MFGVLITDDKKSIRDRLEQLVDGQKLGLHVAGNFSSSSEAIKFIDSECVDLKYCFFRISSNHEKATGLIIEKAMKYINEHYSEEITLKKLSEVTYVNPSYFSRLFKDKTGEKYIDYLTSIRIEQAKKLLEDLSLKVYDITELVGYESRKHFGKTFKEITGMSPREYRDKITPKT